MVAFISRAIALIALAVSLVVAVWLAAVLALALIIGLAAVAVIARGPVRIGVGRASRTAAVPDAIEGDWIVLDAAPVGRGRKDVTDGRS